MVQSMEIIKKLIFLQIFLIITSCSSGSNFDKTKKIWDLYKNKENEESEKVLTKEIVDSVGYPLIEIRTNNIIRRQLLLPLSYREDYVNFYSGSGQTLTLTGFMISKTNGFDIDKIQNTDIITKH